MDQNIDVKATIQDRLHSVWRRLSTAAQEIRKSPENSVFFNKFKEAAEYDDAAHKVHDIGQQALRSTDMARVSDMVETLETEFDAVARRHSKEKHRLISHTAQDVESGKAINFGTAAAMLGDIRKLIKDPMTFY